MNRRILAGRPIAAADLAMLEEAYAVIQDRWGPPSATAGAPAQAERPHRTTRLMVH